MNKSAKTHLIRIGNSRGLRIPKLLLEAAAITDDVELELTAEAGRIVVSLLRRPREGWKEQIEAAGPDDLTLDPYVPTDFDLNEWEW